jgi:hypothetical protein
MEDFYYLCNVNKRRKYMNAIIICGLIVLMLILFFNQNDNQSGNLATEI